MSNVAVVSYEKPFVSTARAIDLSGALDRMQRGDHVFIKPNIVFWSRHSPMPPWGVITTTRVVEDVIVALKERGAGEITIGEGIITPDPKDRETAAHAFSKLGYTGMSSTYGVRVVDLFSTPFREKTLSDDVTLRFSEELLDADFIVDIPVLKTHAQTKVSLSMKNLKGCIDLKSRKICHSANPDMDLDAHVAKLMEDLPPACAVIDGIYTLEKGPFITGKARRSDILIASDDLVSADIAGASVLGIEPSEVPHIQAACEKKGIQPDLSSINIVGEPIDALRKTHKWEFSYSEDGRLPGFMERMGIKGLSFPKYDKSLCSYCSLIVGYVQMAIASAFRGKPFDDVEILTGKIRRPTPGMHHTLLLGKCQVKLNRDHPDIRNEIRVNGCPPNMDKLVKGLSSAGIPISQELVTQIDALPGFFGERYRNRPDFSTDFYQLNGNRSLPP